MKRIKVWTDRDAHVSDHCACNYKPHHPPPPGTIISTSGGRDYGKVTPVILHGVASPDRAEPFRQRERHRASSYKGTSLIRNSAPLGPYSRTTPRALEGGHFLYEQSTPVGAGEVATTCGRWSSNPSGKCSYERPTRGTVCGTMRSMCGADAGCLAINYQSLSGHHLKATIRGYLAHKKPRPLRTLQ